MLKIWNSWILSNVRLRKATDLSLSRVCRITLKKREIQAKTWKVAKKCEGKFVSDHKSKNFPTNTIAIFSGTFFNTVSISNTLFLQYCVLSAGSNNDTIIWQGNKNETIKRAIIIRNHFFKPRCIETKKPLVKHTSVKCTN